MTPIGDGNKKQVITRVISVLTQDKRSAQVHLCLCPAGLEGRNVAGTPALTTSTAGTRKFVFDHQKPCLGCLRVSTLHILFEFGIPDETTRDPLRSVPLCHMFGSGSTSTEDEIRVNKRAWTPSRPTQKEVRSLVHKDDAPVKSLSFTWLNIQARKQDKRFTPLEERKVKVCSLYSHFVLNLKNAMQAGITHIYFRYLNLFPGRKILYLSSCWLEMLLWKCYSRQPPVSSHPLFTQWIYPDFRLIRFNEYVEFLHFNGVTQYASTESRTTRHAGRRNNSFPAPNVRQWKSWCCIRIRDMTPFDSIFRIEPEWHKKVEKEQSLQLPNVLRIYLTFN